MKYPFPKNTFFIPAFLLLCIWSVFFLQILGFGEYTCYGIVPRTSLGLRGILFSPLFHSGLRHIINNSLPLAVLSFFAVLVYKQVAYYVIIFGWILTGILVWLFGNLLPGDIVGCHIGASGIVYLLASFVFFSGIFKKSRNLIAVSLIVVFLYGSMIWGVFPEEFLPKIYREGSNPISWESHLAGGISGLILAWFTKNTGPKRKIFTWENQSEPDAREKWLWEKYKESLPEEERDSLEIKYGEKSDDEPNNDYWFTNDSR